MKKRIALVGPYNTRPATSTSLTPASGTVGVGVVGIMIVGLVLSGFEKDRRFINCHVHSVSDPLQRQFAPYVVKRPGFAVQSTPQAGSYGNAIHVWVGGATGDIISAFGNTNSTIYNDTTSLGTITGLASAIQETKISGVPTLLISSNDDTGWYYPESGTLTKITHAEFPGNNGQNLAGTFAPLAGYAFIMTASARIYNSDLNSVTAWNENNYYANNSYPDTGVGCIRHRNTIVAFGVQSFEVLRNAGTPPPGSPLARIDELTQRIGAIAQQAIINVFDVVYFAGTTQQAGVSIYAYDGGKAQAISTPQIEAQLLLAGPSNIVMSALSWYGITIIVVQCGSLTYGYAVEQSNPWFEMSSQFPIWQRSDGVSIGGNTVNYVISTSSTLGHVYMMSPGSSNYTDNGFPYIATVQTATGDEGTGKRKAYHSVTVIGDHEVSTSPLAITWTDDDYNSWDSDVRIVDLHDEYRETWRLAYSRKRAWRLTHSANTPMRLQALDIDFDPTTS